MAKTSARSRSSTKSRKSTKKSARKSVRKAATKSARKSTATSGGQQSPLAMLFPDLESELATTRRMLERVPEGQNEWRPHAKSRTLGELATHVAQLPGFGLLMATQDEFVGNPARQQAAGVATSAEGVAMFGQLSA